GGHARPGGSREWSRGPEPPALGPALLLALARAPAQRRGGGRELVRDVSSALRRGVAELPLVVVAVILLSTAADILPPDSLLSAGEVRLNLARVLILAGLAAIVYTEGARRELFRARVGLPLALLLAAALVASAKWDTWSRYRFLVEGVALFYLAFATLRSRPQARESLALVAV